MLESSRLSIPDPGTRPHLSNREVGPHVAAEGLGSWENLRRVKSTSLRGHLEFLMSHRRELSVVVETEVPSFAWLMEQAAVARPLECSKLGKQMVGFAFKSPVSFGRKIV